MKDLVLHPATKNRLELFIKSPAQVVLVSGPAGVGKLTVAKRLAEAILELPASGYDVYGHSMVIGPEEDGKSIGIDAARQLERFMRLKVPSDKQYNRAAIIEDSHLMTVEAQNALLKTLEEPPAGTIIILTVSDEPALLPTVRSRAQTIAIQRPDKQSLKTFFSSRGADTDAVDKLYSLSGGSPGLMSALLQDDEHPLKQATEQARQLLSQPLYERLIAVDALSKDRLLALNTVAIMQRMARLSLQSASGQPARRWQRILEASYQATEALTANAQPKLALTNLALQF
jgi:DNA polymerase-3 subunit delta'